MTKKKNSNKKPKVHFVLSQNWARYNKNKIKLATTNINITDKLELIQKILH